MQNLSGQALISREEGSFERNQFELLLSQNNISMIRKWNSSNTEAIKNAVIAGRGIAILSTLLIQKELREGTMQVLHIHDVHVKRAIQLVCHKNKYVTEAMSIFMNICQAIEIL